MKMKEEKQQQVPVWRLVLSSHAHQQQSPKQLQQPSSSSSSSWSLISSGHFSSCSPEPATVPLFPRLRFIEAKSTAPLITGSQTPHQDTSVVDEAMENINRISKPKENVQPKVRDSSPQLEQCSRDGLKGRSPRKRGILTDNFELCNSSIAALKRRKNFEVPLAKQSGVGSLCQVASISPVQISSPTENIRINQEAPLLGDPQNLEQQHVFASSCLFQTASGKSVPISNAAINRAVALIGKTSGRSEIGWNGWTKGVIQSADLKGESIRMNLDVNQCGSLHDNMERKGLEGQNAGSLYQSASGKAISISNSGMNKAMAVFDEIGSLNSGVRRDGSSDEIYDAELNNGSLKMGSLDRNRNASPCEFDRSGISNNVIDNACLKNCSLRMGLLNKKVNAHPHGGLSDSVERKSSEGPNGIPSSCLFQTANGNALSISNVGMGQALSLFGDEIGSNFEVVGNGTGNKTNNDVDLKCDSMRMCFSGEKVSTHQSGLSDVIEQQNVAASLSLFQNSGGMVEYENEINSGKLKDGSLRLGEKVGSCGSLSDNIERQISKEPSVENLKDVSLRTGLPIDKLRTHHPNGDTYGDISDDIEKKYLEEQNVVASSCLLQTAGGTAVSISNARLGKVMSFFGDEAGSNSEDGRNRVYNDATYAANFMDSSVRMGFLGDKESTQTYGDIFNDIERNFDMKSSAEQNVATSSCLFQTASGKAVSISNAALNRAITLFGEKVRSNSKVVRNGMNCDGAKLKDGSLRMGLLGNKVSIHPYRDISDDVSLEEHNVAASPCLFQTASGKAVSISNAALNQAAALFGERLSTNAEVQRNEMNNCQVDGIKIKNGSLNCEQTPNLSMFYTGQGQPVSISSSAMKQAAKRLGQEDHCFTVDAPLVSPSMTFMTVKGQSISVSRSAMKRARNLLAGESDESGVLMTDNVIKEGHLIRVSNDSIERAKVLLGDSSANKFNNSKSTKTRVALDYSKVHEFTPPNRIKSMPVRKIEESNVSTLTRKGQFSRKYFKAPRRVQPELAPKATSSMEPCIQASRTSLLQLVKVYPVQWKGIQRCSLQEFFMRTPHQEQVGELVTRKVKSMTAETSKYYKFSTNVAGIDSVGSDEFRHMLLETGASRQFATKEWVDNHFRWIVWKLASLERSYPTDMGNKLLTIQTVFDELRYRYEREVNRAHRSALKRITEGDALAGTGLVLCIVAIGVKDNNQPDSGNKTQEIKQTVDAPAVQIEITDGWYSIIGQLDQPLVRQVLAGKIFVGQKLRICGASLIGCTTPMPPLEAFQTMKLALHINGTYRAHWADKLGFCKRMPMPIAFHCIKHDGGLVPRTIIGINRIYPVSYYEKLPDHKSIIRCARGEELAIHNYQHRRNQVAEAAFMRMEKEDAPILEGNNMGEGAKLFHALETAAEPELLMADMTAAQLAAFATYQTKREAARQALVEKNIHKALGEVHLDAREVTPFIEINVMGLVLPTAGKCNAENEVASEHQKPKCIMKGGIVTVWQVTEEQVEDLKEGAVYCVSDLYPLVGNSSNQDLSGTVLHLRATKLTKWRLLPQAKFTSFSPRSAIEISSLGTIPFSSEFDVAVLVVHVGRPYAAGLYKKQWLFVSDGSVEENPRNNTALLAINISTTSDAFLPVERSMEGCIVGYCNLVKQRRDQRNCLWVAESLKSSVFTINLSSEKFSHLRNAATKVDKWAKTYAEDVAELQRRIQATLCGVS